jgi:hypothetical protein
VTFTSWLRLLWEFLKGLTFMPDDAPIIPPTSGFPPLPNPLPPSPPPPIPAPGEVGVMYNPPPIAIMPSVMASIENATKWLEPGEMALTAVADRKGGWNGAWVYKGHSGISVESWIGKSWAIDDKLDYGARVLIRKKIGG